MNKYIIPTTFFLLQTANMYGDISDAGALAAFIGSIGVITALQKYNQKNSSSDQSIQSKDNKRMIPAGDTSLTKETPRNNQSIILTAAQITPLLLPNSPSTTIPDSPTPITTEPSSPSQNISTFNSFTTTNSFDSLAVSSNTSNSSLSITSKNTPSNRPRSHSWTTDKISHQDTRPRRHSASDKYPFVHVTPEYLKQEITKLKPSNSSPSSSSSSHALHADSNAMLPNQESVIIPCDIITKLNAFISKHMIAQDLKKKEELDFIENNRRIKQLIIKNNLNLLTGAINFSNTEQLTEIGQISLEEVEQLIKFTTESGWKSANIAHIARNSDNKLVFTSITNESFHTYDSTNMRSCKAFYLNSMKSLINYMTPEAKKHFQAALQKLLRSQDGKNVFPSLPYNHAYDNNDQTHRAHA